jgi:hypothetical protein
MQNNPMSLTPTSLPPLKAGPRPMHSISLHMYFQDLIARLWTTAQ